MAAMERQVFDFIIGLWFNERGGELQPCRIIAEILSRRDIVFAFAGGIAQLVERLVRNEKVRGSNPLTSTNFVRTKFKNQ